MNASRNDPNDRLRRWLEGDLTAAEERDFLAEAERPDADPALAAEVAATRRAIAAVRGLPTSIAPEHDLWPAIARRTVAAPGSEASASTDPDGAPLAVRSRRAGRDGRAVRAVRPWLAIAAALAAAVGAGYLWRDALGPAAPSGPRPSLAVESGPTPVVVPVGIVGRSAYAETDQALAAIRDELRRSIEERQDKLPPETRALVFANLETIDRAIAEIEAALRERPTDPELARTYIAYRKNQIELLRQANRLVARL